MLKKIVLGLLTLTALVVAFAFYKTLQTPSDLWVAGGEFPGCPSRPSCVSSAATDQTHQIVPLAYTGESRSARERLEQLIKAMPDATIVSATPGYLHVLFLTPTMHFHDDMELLVQDGGTIHVRSISRFGYRDRGVNRARVEALRAAFQTAVEAKKP
jgi:uncharacterized protein (DUF1499 family)